ncbi:NXPE family member 3-like isoform X1 [Myxocyprinus asiaticus]|uniref:NXPE family member 3-like isoform X1 n=1 Tax=Myxocyprinus asiaticus TaxID=70543 RepID=UPI002223B714|nr:NXPE family member 3-like isoform X1 [Myxocyprinus asiaticus]XP_051563838.1 NXPE family member 3-like isoform X1 [Myxocyprinus asiaticus]XP_051563839.1 NXPE family member 3-like isoform X1 [Myxocyprinus asiaticus]
MERLLPKYFPFFTLLALIGLIFLLWNITSLEHWTCQTVSTFYQLQNSIQSALKTSELLLPEKFNYSYCVHLGQKPSTEETREESNLLKSIAWPEPLVLGLPLRQSSDPAQSYYIIQNSGELQVGGQLVVKVQMQNFIGQPKKHGGDFLVARLHTPELGAGVTGQVHDHRDGNYTVFFPLLWAGVVQVELTMVHSSEAVMVLRRLREEQSDRVFFKSLFRSGYLTETTVCNLCLPVNQQPLCNYTDPQTGEPWYCYKPKMLGCDTRINHSKGGYKKHLLTVYESQFFQSGINIKIPIHAAGMENVIVQPASKEQTKEKNLEYIPSGYYYQGLWRPLSGVTMRQFNDSSAITQCLRGKMVYMYGDSTVRQLYEYLIANVPEFKEFNFHSLKNVGPHMAADSSNNILLRYRCHGPPIRFTYVYAAELHYISNELDALRGGSDTVVLISIWSHFSTFPVQVFIRRLRHIRRAVIRLLNREPATLVLLRTANLQKLDPETSLYNSDWFSQQLDMVLRAMFKGLNVQLVDAWEMTLAHHHPHQLHPPPAIISNMIHFILSHICPVRRKRRRS